ncbi:MAG: hypothetical protein ACOCYT_04970 [Chloroflexota bacterium]
MKRSTHFYSWALGLLVLAALAVMLALPALAQEEGGEDVDDDGIADPLVTLIGEVAFVDDEITVDGVIVAPASAFIPADLNEGDEVMVTGYLLNDDTLLAAELVPYIADDPEPTEDPTLDPEPTDDPLPPEPTEDPLPPEATPDPTPLPDNCVPLTHPIAVQVADEFDVNVEYVVELHCEGYGFGNIIRAFLLTEENEELDVEALLAQAEEGGWGAILRESGLHPSALAPGRVIGGPPWARDDDDAREDENERRGGPPDDRPGGPPDDRPGGPPDDRPGGPPDDRPGGPPDDRPGGPPDDRPGGPPDDRPGGGPPGRP